MKLNHVSNSNTTLCVKATQQPVSLIGKLFTYYIPIHNNSSSSFPIIIIVRYIEIKQPWSTHSRITASRGTRATPDQPAKKKKKMPRHSRRRRAKPGLGLTDSCNQYRKRDFLGRGICRALCGPSLQSRRAAAGVYSVIRSSSEGGLAGC